MLQRAASNAYSWWWASHIRTKQSKWMEQNLQDMEEKVHEVLKLLHEEGDSFAKRAEMYYKKRPELIIFVEESFKAYRAMAERYDHLSKELQNANTTIASVCPDRVPFPMDDDADAAPPGYKKQKPKPLVKGNIPSVPKTPGKDLKGMVSIARKKLQPKKSTKAASAASHAKSGLNKGEAVEEIDKLQKDILTLQTEKEFVKSSYESGLAKYWDIEKFIKEKQERICGLQDEFGTSMVIEDEEARRLMASAALKSCEDKLSDLQEKQEKTVKEARVERRRIRESREKLDFLKDAYLGNEVTHETPSDPQNKPAEEEEESNEEKEKELDLKTKERLDVRANAALDVTDMAEKIDELVGKVISLETSVSSQTALIQSLRTETNDLQGHIRTLEDDKSTLMDDKNDMSNKLKEMEEKLLGMQDLNRSLEDQNKNLQTHYSEASGNLGHLSDKQDTVNPDKVKPDKESEIKSSSTPEEKSSTVDAKSQEDFKKGGKDLIDGSEKLQEVKGIETGMASDSESVKKSKDTFEGLDEQQVKKDGFEAEKSKDVTEKPKGEDVGPSPKTDGGEILKGKRDSSSEMSKMDKIQSNEAEEQTGETGDEPDWKKLFMNGMESKEKVLLTEYTTLLRSCKEFKNKLSEEKLKTSSNDELKDAEIHELRQKLKHLQAQAAAAAAAQPREEVARTASVDEDDFCMMLSNQPQTISPIEEEFRMDIDELLEENLDFWLRFSTSFHQIQKFDSGVEDLLADLVKVEERKRSDGSSSTAKYGMISDIRPMYRHFRDIHTELTVWLDKSMSLKDELKSRFSSLCNIQDEITKALKASAEDYEFTFTSYQAAKFQGEILNMKQENNKVADELQAGLDHISSLHVEVEKTLTRLSEDYELTGSKNSSINQIATSDNGSRVPLRSFIFGVKQKKQKQSIFSMYKKVRNI